MAAGIAGQDIGGLIMTALTGTVGRSVAYMGPPEQHEAAKAQFMEHLGASIARHAPEAKAKLQETTTAGIKARIAAKFRKPH
jgi:hypothetical protein